ncbi:excalibur calcium-binding domain-containing protein [uncultured Cardiobacterium sp.]|uniref:excalibur calcium-binding domain-containing protein n=1 Tax=uncultured Cardiobacterium sp. TaxID=417619 RepID=UPI002611CD18|nr:excalibur calcium-binding domain-containing protein [uncultured Cardiobacterium sp.]
MKKFSQYGDFVMVKCFSLLFLMVAVQSAGAVTSRDFSNQEEAQKYHDEHGGNTRLDGDKDGEACECLEGGSAYGNPKCDIR